MGKADSINAALPMRKSSDATSYAKPLEVGRYGGRRMRDEIEGRPSAERRPYPSN